MIAPQLLAAAPDYTGIAALISAITGFFAMLFALLSSLTARRTHAQVKPTNGRKETTGELMEQLHDTIIPPQRRSTDQPAQPAQPVPPVGLGPSEPVVSPPQEPAQ